MPLKRKHKILYAIIGLIILFFLIYPIIKINPDKKARQYYEQGKYQSAIKEYKKTLEANPELHTTYHDIGVCYRKLGQYDKAIEYYKKSISIKPSAETYNEIGGVYDKKGNFDKAEISYKKAIEVNPKYPHSFHNLGIIYKEQKEYDKAILYFEKALQIDPKFALSYYGLGLVHEKKEDYNKAIQSYKEALKYNPDMAKAYFRLGVVYYKKKNYEKAVLMIEDGLKIKTDIDYQFFLAALYHKLDKFNKETRVLKKILKDHPNNADAMSGLAYIYLEQNTNLNEAFKLAQKAYNLKPDDHNIIDALAFAYYRKGAYSKAISLYKDALKLDNLIGEIHLHLALAYFKNNQIDKAKQGIKKAIELDKKTTLDMINNDKLYKDIKNNPFFKDVL